MEVISLEMLQEIFTQISPNILSIALIFYLAETIIKFVFSIIFPKRFSGFDIQRCFMVKIIINIKDNSDNSTEISVVGDDRNASVSELFVSSLVRNKLKSLCDYEGFEEGSYNE